MVITIRINVGDKYIMLILFNNMHGINVYCLIRNVLYNIEYKYVG